MPTCPKGHWGRAVGPVAPNLLPCLLVASLAHAAVPLPPKPTRYVNDQAGVFDVARRDALNEKLAAFERETSNQVIVYVAPSLPAGTTIEEMGAAAIKEWGVGQRGQSNGVIFFVFVADRAMRIEVGYGLEGAIPDARAKQITSDVVKPLFKKGDYAAGVEAGADAIMGAARGDGGRGSLRTVRQATPVPKANGRTSDPFSVVFFVVVFGILVAVLLRFLDIFLGRVSTTTGGSSGSSGVDRGASSSSSDSSPSSDFSGGGGSGGGGGASDSW